MKTQIRMMALLFAFFSINTSAMNMGGDKAQTKVVMNRALNSFVNLFPYIHDGSKFSDKSNEEYINSQLDTIIKAFKTAKHTTRLDVVVFKPSLETIQTHLADTKDAFNSKHKMFARNRLQALSGLCMSCHTQLKKQSSNRFNLSLQKIKRDSFDKDLEYADFLFLLRDYTSSARYFEKVLTKYTLTKKDVSFDDYRKALQRLITINMKISYKPERALQYLEKYGKDKTLPLLLREDFIDWRDQIASMSKSYKSWVLTNGEELRNFEKKNLLPIEEASLGDGSKDMVLLAASGVLTKFLNLRPKSPEAPRALYWLGVAERRLSFNFFYSLGELYLKECVTEFQKHPYAKKCLGEYENMLRFGYSGSGGEALPDDEKKELEKLKSLLK